MYFKTWFVYEVDDENNEVSPDYMTHQI